MGIREIFGRAKPKNNNTVNREHGENKGNYGKYSTASPDYTTRSGSSSSRHQYHANGKNVTRHEIKRPVPQGHSYNAAVAAAPPVTGSYPVAGNGPNILNEIQKSRARRDSAQSVASHRSFSLSRGHSKSQSRSENVEAIPPIEVPTRPQTAPNDGVPGKHMRNPSDSGRTRSGFSMKNAPSFFSSHKRKDSVRSNKSSKSVSKTSVPAPPPTPPPLPIPRPRSTTSPYLGMRRRGTRSPSNPPNAIPEGFTQAFPSNHLSRKGHVDLFDAHSTIKQNREQSKSRTQASGMRSYGEDVADRNIIAHLDLNSPEFGYLKSVYLSGNKSNTSLGNKKSETESPVGIAISGPTRRDYSFIKPPNNGQNVSNSKPVVHYHRLGTTHIRQGSNNILGQSTPDSPTTDDTLKKQYFGALTPAAVPAESTVPPTNNLRGFSPNSPTDLGVTESPPTIPAVEKSGPGVSYPPRTDSVTSRSYSANRGHDDDGSSHNKRTLPVHNRTKAQIFRSGSTLSRMSIEEEPSYLVPFVNAIDFTPTSPYFSPSHSKSFSTGHTLSRSSSLYSQEPFSSRHEQLTAKQQRPIDSPSATVGQLTSHLRQISDSSIIRSPHWSPRSSSMSSQSTVLGHRRGSSSNGSGSYSTYPSTTSPPYSPQSPREKRENYIIEGSSEPISLEGIVDLSNTVDTTVTTKQLPGTSSPPVSFNPRSPNTSSRLQQSLSNRANQYISSKPLPRLNASKPASRA